jgi:pimeloyl-ACP methyl ester carboxylesterase
MKAAPVNIPLSWGTLEGLRWSRPGKPRVLCLHGWLDNAASFVPLSAHLEDFDLVAIDFAGHGFSAHRPETSRYYFPENMYDVDAVLDALGWDDCHIIGHSLGGGVACGFTAALPERVKRLVLLDVVGIFTIPVEQATRQLRLSLKSVRKNRSILRPYESVEEAMLARQKNSPLSDAAARLICERALEHTGDYYQWRTDPRLNWRSPQFLTNDQVINILESISSPVLAITTATIEKFLGGDVLDQRLASIGDCIHVFHEGHHHFHMEEAETVAAHITEFLQKQDKTND